MRVSRPEDGAAIRIAPREVGSALTREGIGYDATLWTLHQVPSFAQRFKVVIFDNRDIGRSGAATEAYSIADMADDVAGLLDGERREGLREGASRTL